MLSSKQATAAAAVAAAVLLIACAVATAATAAVSASTSTQAAPEGEGQQPQFIATGSTEDNSSQPEVTSSTVYRSDKLFTNSETTLFEPTDEWQEVGDNVAVPRGLEIRLDMANHKRYARKMRDANGNIMEPAKGELPDHSAQLEQAPLVIVDEPETVAAVVTADGDVADADQLAVQAEEAAAASTTTTTTTTTTPTTPLTLSEASPEDVVDKQRRILLELPEPDLELQKAVEQNLPREELEALLQKVWDRRQKELREAADAIVSDASLMAELLKKITAEGADALDEDGMVDALADLEYHVTDIDNAGDFTNMGGLAIAANLLKHESLKVVKHAAWVIGSTVKYNEGVQAAALDAGLVPDLIRLLDSAIDGGSKAHAHVAIKAVYALGALLRFHKPAQAQFAAFDGMSSFERLLSLPASTSKARGAWSKAVIKAVTLLGDLVTEVDSPKASSGVQRFRLNEAGDMVPITDEQHAAETEKGVDISAFVAALRAPALCPAFSNALNSHAHKFGQQERVVRVMSATSKRCEDVYREPEARRTLDNLMGDWAAIDPSSDALAMLIDFVTALPPPRNALEGMDPTHAS